MDLSYLLLGTEITDPTALCPIRWTGKGLALHFTLPFCGCSFPGLHASPCEPSRISHVWLT